MKMNRLIFIIGSMAGMLYGFSTLAQTPAATDNLEVWFDSPTSIKGRQTWYGGHPELWTKGKKPIASGDFNGNTDPEWETQSLPIGNGSIGGNVMGSIMAERITLNEKTLWRGGPNTSKGASYYWNVNKESARFLPEIRQAFLDGDDAKASRLTSQNFNSTVSYEVTGEEPFRFGSFTTMGELWIETGLDENEVCQYRRALSLDSALVTVSFRHNDVDYVRNMFVSYPDNIMVIRFAADRKEMQNLVLSYSPSPVSEGKMMPDGTNGLCYTARLDNNGMKYVVRLRAFSKGGTVHNEDGRLHVVSADEVYFLLSADTDYKPNYNPDFSDPLAYVGVDPLKTTRRWMDRASRKDYTWLLQRHYDDYSSLFDRVRFELAGKRNDKPTYKRLEAYRKGHADPFLETLYYQYGRYLLIASSRPNNLPANLQGMWHNNVDGPWRVDYHNNINLQMNYWPSLSTNLAECAQPLADFIRLLQKPGRVTARNYFGARGWTASISANIFGFTTPLEGQDMGWNYNPMAGPWLATHLWEYYDYTRNKDFLRKIAYPIIKESAMFVEDFLWKRPDGVYVAAPSTSPEHGPIDQGATFVHAVAREILLDAIAAARVLDKDKEESQRWQYVLDHLMPYQIGRYGQLMEWSRDIDDPKDQHRHVNHLYGLHPGHTVSPLTTPRLAEASKVVLNHRGDGATGWSMGWKLNQWARLHDGNRSYKLYSNLLKNGTADNLWDMHPPFQIDGNFGGTAGVTEMLMQSHAGCIHLLPALPDAWSEGYITGLRARGNFGVDLSWREGKLQEATITSGSGDVCQLRYGVYTLAFETRKGGKYRVRLGTNGLVYLKL